MHPPFVEIISELATEVGPLSAAAVEAHAGGDRSRWNTRQIIEHLALTYRVSSANLQDRLAKGRPTQYRPTLNQLSSKFVLLRLGYFPPGRPAPAAVTPSINPLEAADGYALVKVVDTDLHRLDGILNACQVHFGKSALATHQILGPLSVAEWRRFHLLHARHHLKRIRKLTLDSSMVNTRSFGTT